MTAIEIRDLAGASPHDMGSVGKWSSRIHQLRPRHHAHHNDRPENVKRGRD